MAGTHSIIFLVTGLAMVFVVHVLVVIWALKWGFRARTSRVGENAVEGGGGAGLSAEEVGDLPCHEFKEGASAGAGECAVCLEVFQAGERRRVLPRCGHGFHAECVDSWLRKNRRCPICRAEVVAGHGKNASAVTEAATLEIVTVER
ncbi:E3 ubiquitin-protein ligase EL5-like [Phragmites australis]|uniref:E3 ubiquitin-protein ligase EL5-like n=1 Tax=Phragmites australis TaxID=29695 RepID=UPI002D782BB8|nr:E3 ubiquitin-protein ligase EL5-like [Phragmites australis]